MDQRFPCQVLILLDNLLVGLVAVSTIVFLAPLSFFVFLIPISFFVFVAPLSFLVPGPPGPVVILFAPVFVVGHAFSYS